MAKKMNRSCGDVSPRKKMAMEGTMGSDRPRKFQRGGMVDNITPEQAMQVGRQMAAQMAAAQMKPRADVTGMDDMAMDRAMNMRRSRMSSGGMRPQMRRNRMV
jgi:hypothetical protein